MIQFGTGGWRDIIGENFTFGNVRIFAQGVARKIISEKKQSQGIVIGFDNRFMSEEYAKAAAEVFAANRIHVLLLAKSVPTPLVTYVTKMQKTAAGMTFTASHNSYIYNGIKFVGEDGTPATVAVTKELEQLINQIKTEEVQRLHYDLAVQEEWIKRVDYHHEFVDFIKEKLDIKILKNAGLNVIYDPMYGTGVTSVLTLLVDIRSNFKMIHDRIDPLFGGRVPAPSKETLWRISSMMREGDFDIGLATDGDADRIAVIDNEGKYIHPNEILSILYYYFLEYKKKIGAVVRNVSTTHLLDAIAAHYGQKCIEKPVGFKYIAEGLLESDAIIGGESSGGITIRDHLLEKDGILSAGLILEMMASTGKTLKEIRQELVDKFGEFHYVEDNMNYMEGKKQRILDFLAYNFQPQEIAGQAIKEINQMDGVKLIFENGDWLGIRFSGTEPLIRFMAESAEEQVANELVQQMKEIIIQQLKN